jgi:hypothetical protein
MSRPKLVMFDEPSLGLARNVVERTLRCGPADADVAAPAYEQIEALLGSREGQQRAIGAKHSASRNEAASGSGRHRRLTQ